MPKQLFFFGPDDGGEGGGTTTDDKKGEIVDTPGFKDFRKQFEAREKNPMLVGELPTKEQLEHAGVKTDDKEKTDEQKAADAENERLKQQNQQRRGPGQNLPAILEAKRKAEAEANDLKTKVTAFETEKQTLETKIAEMQTKIDSGKLTDAKEAEFQQKITALEERIQKGDETIVNENKRLKDRVSLYDLTENDTFKEKYYTPVIEAYNEAEASLGADEAKIELLGRALNANASALQAKTKEARLQHERDRSAIINQIVQGMGEFEGDGFKLAMQSYIRRSQAHAAALTDYSKTAAQIREQEKQRSGEAYQNLITTWGKAFDNSVASSEDDASLTPEEKKLADDLGIKVEDELKTYTVQGKKAVTGKATMQESADIVSKGRLYPVLKAKIAVRDKQLADAQELIKKLRAGGTGGGTSSEQRKEAPKTGVVNEDGEKMNRDEWQKKRFGANRPGLVKKD